MKIELSEQQLQVIEEALQQLPYNVAAPLIGHIRNQKQTTGELVITGTIRSPLLTNGYIQCSGLINTSDSQSMM
ncbi:hypothetical protein V6231_03500 [Escherichia coli]|uniref:hypothetical protein n=1 Tax=Escherichia coli TaxID=562 RepID=UPI002FE59490